MMINTETYFDTYDYAPVIEEIFKENNIQSDDNHYNRHMQEMKKKIEEAKRNFKTQEYFKKMPVFDKDFSSYVIRKNKFIYLHINSYINDILTYLLI